MGMPRPPRTMGVSTGSRCPEWVCSSGTDQDSLALPAECAMLACGDAALLAVAAFYLIGEVGSSAVAGPRIVSSRDLDSVAAHCLATSALSLCSAARAAARRFRRPRSLLTASVASSAARSSACFPLAGRNPRCRFYIATGSLGGAREPKPVSSRNDTEGV